MQKEFSSVKGFDDWYTAQQSEMRKNDLMRFLVDRRNYILKQGPMAMQASFSVTIEETLSFSSSLGVKVTRAHPWYRRELGMLREDVVRWLREKCRRLSTKRPTRVGSTAGRSATSTSVQFFFDDEEWRQVPAVDLVAQYLGDLDTVVSHAERKFSVR
jgi:hypothetical protein